MVWLSLMLAWAGSRTILLYLVALVALAGLWHWRGRSPESRRALWAMGLSCLAILVMQFALPLINQLVSMLMHTDVHTASGVARLAANSDDMGSRRFAEMHKARLAFREHPLTGVGWSQFAAESVRMQPWPQFAAASIVGCLPMRTI
ncbi:O-antigen ligase family protein [Paludibacterium denitrificans]|uniref:O-antigen ligase family protein n=1 Tax=Paludibacterium denitrificans TaxID=2675226 RepID=UPI001E310686|nr:O-antigen ligase family protein [Paludibacterium denitrificans]